MADPVVCPTVVWPPSTPGAVPLAPSDVTTTSVHLRWGASGWPSGACYDGRYELTGYKITYSGGERIVPPGTTDTVIGGLQDGTEYSFSVIALSNYLGRPSGSSAPLVITATTEELTCLPVILPPGKPGSAPISDADITSTSVRLRWTASPTPRCASPATSYRITYGDKTVEVPATQTDVVITGLAPETAYAFSVAGVGNGLPSEALVVDVTTDADLTGYPRPRFSLTGSATLKTLTRGALPLRGDLIADLTLATGALEGDLTLSPTSGRLIALSFLPVTAKIAFVPSGKTTGKLLGGVLTTNTKVRIKVQEVKLFGAIPLAGGNSCQTRQLSDVTLKSTQEEFLPLVGGPLAGTFKISDLNGCGALNGLVSPLAAGSGNTIALNLTPKV